MGGFCNFFAPDYALSSAQPWFYGEKENLALSPAPLPPIDRRVEPSSAAFAAVFEEILTGIRAGRFEKVVPIVCEELEFESPLSAEMFSAVIAREQPQQYGYGFEYDGEGLVGVTPELLFDVEGDQLTTMALAGTARADGPDLLEDRKELHEHGLVIEHIVSELRPWGQADVGRTQERVYGVLKHLYTPITLRLREPADFMQLIVRLHPTAALGGWPRRPAVEWLQNQDFHLARRRFGAPFGYVDGTHMRCVVAIRCLQWWRERALLSAGCGIVAESQVLKEWNELALKRRAAAGLLGLAL